MSKVSKTWDWYFFQGYSGESLGALRALFGAGLFFFHFTQFIQLIILDPFGPDAKYIEPIWYFEALGITSNIPWLNIPIFIVLLTATIFFMLGKWTKPAILILVLSIFYLKGVRDSFAGDVHHRYLVPVTMMFLFFFSKCNYRFAFDGKKYTNQAVETWEASWPIRTAQTYIIMFYFWALVAKLRVTGWTWFEPAGQIQAKLIERSVRSGFTETGELVRRAHSFELAQYVWLIFIFGILVTVFELLAPIVLFVRKRWVMSIFLLGAFCFHIANYILLNVQFYFYPIVFLAFFNMAFFAEWFRGRFGSQSSVPESSI